MPQSISTQRTVSIFLILGLVIGLVLGVYLIFVQTALVEESKESSLKSYADDLTRVVARDIEELLASRESFTSIDDELVVKAIAARMKANFSDLKDIENISIVDSRNRIIYSPEETGKTDRCAEGHGIGSGKVRKAAGWETDEKQLYCSLRTLTRSDKPVGGVRIHRSTAGIRAEVAALRWKMAGGIVLVFALLYSALGLLAIQANRQIRSARDAEARTERMAAIGNLAAGVAHEIKNPLNAIGLTTQYLSRKLEEKQWPELESELQIIRAEIDRLTNIISEFTSLARPATVRKQPEDLPALIHEVVSLFKDQLDQEGIESDVRTNGVGIVSLDAARMHGVLTNLVKNAIEAMEGGGQLSIEATDKGKFVSVSVADSGGGITREQARHIFEPYFTTKPDGLGLGLALARRIVAAHGGTIEAESVPGTKCVFTITIPKT